MSKNIHQSRHGLADRKAPSPSFSCLGELVSYYGRMTPGRNAILAPGRAPLTYRALRDRVHDAVWGLRDQGVGRSDRVAVVLPDGPDAAVAMIAVAVGATCVPLNPGLTADEWQRYLGVLRVSALLTRADVDSASRGVAHTLGIPVMDLSVQSSNRPDGFSVVGSATRPIVGGAFATSADDAFILLTSGTTSLPKMVPITHRAACLSAHNAARSFSAWTSGPIVERTPAVPCAWPNLRAPRCIGGRLDHGLHARLRCYCLLRLADRLSPNLVYGGPADPSGRDIRGGSPEIRRPAVLLAGYPFGLVVSAT